jgi:hypothetical protein
MNVPRHRLIAQRREQLGIDIAEIARRTGVSISEYRDVELYENELIMALPLKNARSLASILGYELGNLVGAGPPTVTQKASKKRSHIILVEARRRLGIAADKMAADIGFDEIFIHCIENDHLALESYPYDVLRIVADYLKLDPRDLLFATTA